MPTSCRRNRPFHFAIIELLPFQAVDIGADGRVWRVRHEGGRDAALAALDRHREVRDRIAQRALSILGGVLGERLIVPALADAKVHNR